MEREQANDPVNPMCRCAQGNPPGFLGRRSRAFAEAFQPILFVTRRATSTCLSTHAYSPAT